MFCIFTLAAINNSNYYFYNKPSALEWLNNDNEEV